MGPCLCADTYASYGKKLSHVARSGEIVQLTWGVGFWGSYGTGKRWRKKWSHVARSGENVELGVDTSVAPSLCAYASYGKKV